MKDKKDWGPADEWADAQMKGGCFAIVLVGGLLLFAFVSGFFR